MPNFSCHGSFCAESTHAELVIFAHNYPFFIDIFSFVMLAAGAAILLIFALMYISVFIFLGGRREAKGVKWFQFCASGDTHFAGI